VAACVYGQWRKLENSETMNKTNRVRKLERKYKKLMIPNTLQANPRTLYKKRILFFKKKLISRRRKNEFQ